ncbi:MAG: DUF3343 domain-containing protein [Clostridia bacterium]|nr:DUF3343 domain-containing protein [Clostridia bacterium]
MNRITIKFSSITHAMRAKELIENNGGNAIIRKNLNPQKGEGCGYSLVIKGNVNRFINLLNINKIKYTGFDYG